MENKKCPNCENELIETIAGSSLNYECKHCGYAYSTTIATGIEWDFNDYIITIEKNTSVDINQIKTVSKISTLNFIESKKILLNGGTLDKGSAIIVKTKIDKLKEANIKFNVTPNFKY